MLITKIEMVLNRKKSLTRATTHLFLSLPSFSESNVHKKKPHSRGKNHNHSESLLHPEVSLNYEQTIIHKFSPRLESPEKKARARAKGEEKIKTQGAFQKSS